MKDCSALHCCKFGGSSLENIACLEQVQRILKTKPGFVVVSAMGKTTNFLIKLYEAAEAGKDLEQGLAKIKNQHLLCAQALLSASCLSQYQKVLEAIMAQLRVYLLKVKDNGPCGESYKAILATGERLCAPLVAAFLPESAVLDAQSFIVVDEDPSIAIIRWRKSQQLFDQCIAKLDARCKYIVITGFIAANTKGQLSLLGRNGSDYSAAIVSRLAKV